ncbi:MAG: hypothetical protein IT299_02825 [Dehalococcoidia bacterium]|nr:hypothetical protein [Dehalococcoidia bacterium]
MSRRTLARAALVVAYGVAGALLGFAIAASIMVMGAATFWLFIFGDDPWPAWAENGLVVGAYAIGLAVLVVGVRAGWRRASR